MTRSWITTRRWITPCLLSTLALAGASACSRHHEPESGVAAGKRDKAAADTGAAVAVVATPAPGAPATAVILKVADKPGVGMFLTDAGGHALYVFQKDKGGKSSCTGDCARAWRPVTGRASAAPATAPDSAVKSGLIGTTARDDGTPQVTYNEMPLYYFQGDQAANDTNGEGKMAFGAGWSLITPDGRLMELRAHPAPPENAAPPPPR